MNIVSERNLLFDENFKYKSTDSIKMVRFCNELKRITGIQTCNCFGMMYEYLPEVYESALKHYEM